MKEAIEQALDSVRPMLALHRGGVDFVAYNEETKTVQVRLKGTCHGCPLSSLTLKAGIEEILKEKVPGVLYVESV
ncbi:MAG: NifU family protein [Candidatus Sungbacteria bacterium]|uniref:NifU family protein n=1 Tax=Candidatus Sungiibacteriota bacterium TaxID=2750080 RepID=A0A9D6LPB4_9BACT|nr:NifU family protein [Candidatus Sungbacteria bacterium]